MADAVFPAWRKSSFSDGGSEDQSNCVEVAVTSAAVGVRDSKSPATPALTFTPASWSRFLTNLR
ncbi:protein of unknown function [Amycolatopsis marina]|uniref:DUF397 domain-containing protein n=1 Tax=Amycolatopsis marina TaxID=490629 RepID=A0A1I0W872_9PSEU|nr:DUF397 domain-containing protein [Amycolatopsis marina]SFA84935.1 protein of unknown function [Amycolatopsis marina]